MTLQEIMPFIVGPVAGLVLSCIGNWYQAGEKKALQIVIEKKDTALAALTREAVQSITTLSGLNQTNQLWQQQTTATLKEIREHLPHN